MEAEMEYSDELITALEAAQSAGKEIRKVWYRKDSSVVLDAPEGGATATKSNHADLQTATDRKCETIIVHKLKERFPEYLIIGEEESSEGGKGFKITEQPTFIVDPIDGTTNFVHSLPSCSVLISLMKNKVIEMGVVLDPIRGEVFFAEKGKGAFHQNLNFDSLLPVGQPERIRTSGQTDPAQSMVAGDCGYKRKPDEVAKCLKLQETLLVECRIRGWRILGGCGLALAYVACGRLDAYIEDESPYLWDFSAGSLLVTEAGGFVADPKGSPLDFTKRNIFATSSPELGQRFLAAIN
mmetsp:Transcript_7783/g.12580  ORF Transcript_7783/g.12580 Transcript_7783/m.12580 type:complete len:296 (+) Transcript_7783:315-1202(+)